MDRIIRLSHYSVEECDANELNTHPIHSSIDVKKRFLRFLF